MRTVLIPVLTLCLLQIAFAENDAMRKTEPQIVGSGVDAVHLQKYEKDYDYLKKRADHFARSQMADVRAFYDVDARRIGPGTLVVESTVGMCIIQAMTYSLECERQTTDLEIAQIDWGKGEMTARMPGVSARDAVRQDQAEIVNIGESVSKHFATLKEALGEGRAAETSSTNALLRCEVLTWKVGDGYLEIEATLGAGLVKDITYVVGDENREKRTRMKVKNVDLTKGEMTIIFPESSEKQSDGEDKREKR